MTDNEGRYVEERVCLLPEIQGMASFESGNTTIYVRERIIRCKDCEHSTKDGTLCRYFAAYEPIAGGDEYAEMPAEVEPDGFCKWAKPKWDA